MRLLILGGLIVATLVVEAIRTYLARDYDPDAWYE